MGHFSSDEEYYAKEEKNRTKLLDSFFQYCLKENSEEEIARRKATGETVLFMLEEEQKPIVKIENNKGFYSADCPNCGKIKILSSELKSMSAVCNKCYCAFNLEE